MARSSCGEVNRRPGQDLLNSTRPVGMTILGCHQRNYTSDGQDSGTVDGDARSAEALHHFSSFDIADPDGRPGLVVHDVGAATVVVDHHGVTQWQAGQRGW